LDVDAVKKRSEILVLDDGCLLDSGADLGDVFKVDSLDGQVVLLLFLLADEDALGSINSLVQLEAQEVLDLDGLNDERCTLPFSMTLTAMGKWE
jgi:hypothetical protein